MQLVPTDYSSLNLSSSKKMFLMICKKRLGDDFKGFLELNPTGGPIPTFLLILHRSIGLVCIVFNEGIGTENVVSTIQLLKPNMWTPQEAILRKKLQRERRLVNSDGEIIVNVNWIYAFPDADRMTTSNTDSYNYIFKEDIARFLKEEDSLNNFLLSKFSHEQDLAEEVMNHLGFIIAPEYYIPLNVEKLVPKNDIDIVSDIKHEYLSITNKHQIAQALSLDSDQIDLINQFNTNDHLLLACAGSGKSSILLSKALRFASAYPDKKVLVTCFNKNLAQYYMWRIDVAGFTNRNLECRTFHSFCLYLLDYFNINRTSLNFGTDDYDQIFSYALQQFKSGKIKPEYDAIFIDEVQVFKKEWYEFCYNMLVSKSKDKHLFVIAGDKSQNVNNNIAKGLAPWQVEKDGFPTFRGSTVRIEKNYRNCIEINNYINGFVRETKQYLQTFEIDVSKREDLFLRGKAVRHGYEPKIICSSRVKEVQEVFRAIDELESNHGIPLSQIAILIPQRQYRTKKYYILKWLTDEFNRRGIDCTPLLNDDEHYVRYGERKGVSICTIESALGLDFQAVIICGLLPLGHYEQAYEEQHLIEESITEEIRMVRREEFFKNVNQLYTGMTRARDFLYVILSHDQSNIYSKILLNAMKEKEPYDK